MQQRSQNKDEDSWISQSSLFREWDKMKQEILDHKWYESERAGRDIGWDRASVDWLVKYGRKGSSD